jgi:hypothetical protein
MGQLSLVKSLSHLKEEQSHAEEVLLDAAGIAFTRGSLAEMTGEPSAGKTSLALSLLAKLTQEGEVCAVADACDSFDPRSAHLAEVALENLLWVKCGGDLEKVFLAADYLVQAKGFGAIWLNLNGMPPGKLRYVPRTYWYRYRTRIKETPTLFLVTADEPVAGSVAQQSFRLAREQAVWSGQGKFKLLQEIQLSLQSRKELYRAPRRTTVEADYRDV